MPKMDFAELSCEYHENHADYEEGEDRKRRESFPDSNWLTAGDGQDGPDGHYIEQRRADVLAIDI